MNKYFIISFALILIFILLMFGGCSGKDSSNRFYELLKLVPSEAPYDKAPMTLFDYTSYREDNNISFSTSRAHRPERCIAQKQSYCELCPIHSVISSQFSRL